MFFFVCKVKISYQIRYQCRIHPCWFWSVHHFIVNKWKPKWVHVGYSWSHKKRKKKKTPKRPKWSSKSQEDTLIKVNGQQCRQYSVLPQSDLFFPLRTLQGSVSVRLIKVSTNQWHHWGCVHLAIFDHLWVFEIVSGLNSVERTYSERQTEEVEKESQKKREKRGQWLL